jgi:hypothetical protein
MRGSPTPCPAQPQSHAPNVHHSPRRACQKRESSRRRCAIAESRAQFRECAMRGSPPPRPARLGSPRAKYAPLWTVSAPNQGVPDVLVRKSPRRGPNFANTQSEAAQRRVTHCPGLTRQMYITIQGGRVKRGNLRGVVVISPSRGPNHANTQCEAVHGRIPLGVGPHALSTRRF